MACQDWITRVKRTSSRGGPIKVALRAGSWLLQKLKRQSTPVTPELEGATIRSSRTSSWDTTDEKRSEASSASSDPSADTHSPPGTPRTESSAWMPTPACAVHTVAIPRTRHNKVSVCARVSAMRRAEAEKAKERRRKRDSHSPAPWSVGRQDGANTLAGLLKGEKAEQRRPQSAGWSSVPPGWQGSSQAPSPWSVGSQDGANTLADMLKSDKAEQRRPKSGSGWSSVPLGWQRSPQSHRAADKPPKITYTSSLSLRSLERSSDFSNIGAIIPAISE